MTRCVLKLRKSVAVFGFVLVLSAPQALLAQFSQPSSPIPSSKRSAYDLSLLLRHSQVREKLEVSDEAYAAVWRLLATVEKEAPKSADFVTLNPDNARTAFSAMDAAAERVDEDAWELLTELLPPDRMSILMGAFVRARGISSILNQRIAAQLQLTPEQIQQIQDKIRSVKEQKRRVFQDVAKGNTDGLRKSLLKLNEEYLTEEVSSVLTEKQRTDLAKMLVLGKDLVPQDNRITFGW